MSTQECDKKPIKRRRPSSSPKSRPPIANCAKSVKNSHTSPRRIIEREQIAEALELRKTGLTHAEIGARFNISAKTAHKWICRGMEKLIPAETAEQVRAIELHRLDSLINRIWPQCTADNLAAINTYTRLADARAKLMGLYPRDPVQIGINTGSTGPSEPDGIQINFVSPSHKMKSVFDMAANLPPNPYDGAAPNYATPAIEKPRARTETPFGSIVEEPRANPDPHAHLPKWHSPDSVDNTKPAGGAAPPSLWDRGDPKGWMR
jgi:hypothetical protein